MMSLEEIDARVKHLPDEGDPLIWLRQRRREMSDRFATVREMMDYLEQFGSVEIVRARLRGKIADVRESKFPNAETLQAIAELESGEGKTFPTVEEFMADLGSHSELFR